MVHFFDRRFFLFEHGPKQEGEENAASGWCQRRKYQRGANVFAKGLCETGSRRGKKVKCKWPPKKENLSMHLLPKMGLHTNCIVN